MKEIRFTDPFKRRLKKLSKRYRQIREDINPVLEAIKAGNLVGTQIIGVSQTVFKVRAKNSDIPTGKSGGYRIIYQVFGNEIILLLVIYAKSEQTNITASEIEDIIKETLDQSN
ncbi:type II toxin-antitoxin system RelE family toxin [Dactylococcopsis salina]|uniref:Cytotoxic translational repressor of toxin-antitoxin stability system n=1 Tax=Dactylococcopsis salina (strain PCC 8305) TaxID=13035 RepID=K9YS99_DACS8|nr:type II toxin-antitoxin system RelE/ParE family toxin [Dactylococcopsis salina]AFZ49754.1 cytotoxic translational repressor of toxin-antitoxin stability system [Dactylococcopsis salina PCC 8305]